MVIAIDKEIYMNYINIKMDKNMKIEEIRNRLKFKKELEKFAVELGKLYNLTVKINMNSIKNDNTFDLVVKCCENNVHTESNNDVIKHLSLISKTY